MVSMQVYDIRHEEEDGNKVSFSYIDQEILLFIYKRISYTLVTWDTKLPN